MSSRLLHIHTEGDTEFLKLLERHGVGRSPVDFTLQRSLVETFMKEKHQKEEEKKKVDRTSKKKVVRYVGDTELVEDSRYTMLREIITSVWKGDDDYMEAKVLERFLTCPTIMDMFEGFRYQHNDYGMIFFFRAQETKMKYDIHRLTM